MNSGSYFLLILNETSLRTPKVITRIKGGLGNQLFCYAAARRLALVNNVELVIDDSTGFVRDRAYQRQYALNHFNIRLRKATRAERLEPFERYRRGLMKRSARKKPFTERRYIEQEGTDFDSRLMALKVNGTIYLDGVWSNEEYFRDVEQSIREDLRITPPSDHLNQRIADEICKSNSVAVHVRRFVEPGNPHVHCVSPDYYQRALALIEGKLESPRYFIFSDDPDAAQAKLGLPEGRTTLVSHNAGEENAYADLWLMTQCRHFIIANSTFSWWGAWLASEKEKIVVGPEFEDRNGRVIPWSVAVQIPPDWLEI